jgi:hypothetical protein
MPFNLLKFERRDMTQRGLPASQDARAHRDEQAVL